MRDLPGKSSEDSPPHEAEDKKSQKKKKNHTQTNLGAKPSHLCSSKKSY